jgi:hypothetical protein
MILCFFYPFLCADPSLPQDILKQLYDFNHTSEHWEIKSVDYYRQSKKSGNVVWGGGRTRRLLQAAYVVAFLCLLRFDEVLKIQLHHIELISEKHVKLTLPFRKTHQFGGV